MSIAAIRESFKKHFNEEIFLKNNHRESVATTTTATLPKSIPTTNTSFKKSLDMSVQQQQQRYPLANSTKTNDYECSTMKTKTPSLQQEMNLARRACWSNENSNTDKNKINNSNICTYKTLTADDIDADDADDDVAENDDDDADRSSSDPQNIVNNVTTVLNGAIIINNENLNVNANKNIQNISINETNYLNNQLINENVAKIPNLSANNNAKLNKLNGHNVNSDTDTEMITDNDNTTTSPTSSHKNSNFKNIVTSTSDCSTTTKTTLSREFLNYARAELLNFWLQFVAICDAITIKHDDPRFAELRQREKAPHGAEPKPPTSSSSTSTPTAATSTTSSKYKLLKSKKFLFLFGVCLFFSCLHRIEGRPNMSTISNLIMGGGSTTPAAIDGIVETTLPIRSSDNAASADMNAAFQPMSNDQPSFNFDDHGLPNVERSKKSAEGEEPHRYPLAGVDFERVKTPFIIGIWILSASIAKIGFHMTPKLHLIFPESCLLIVVGVVIGVVLFFCTDVAVSPLTPNTFFFYMLPPIILDAGYFMPNRLFFDNLGTILLMAVVGTIFNIATIGGSLYAIGLTGLFGGKADTPKLLDTFLFASLISAVDPVAVLAVFEEIHVNEILYIVVFGESLLNDAVTVVMYHMMEVYNEIGISEIIAQDVASGVGSFFVVAIGGTLIGIIWGFLTGLVTRFTDHVRVIEPIFIFVMAYLAYLNAEIFHMSGILAITFCGITMKNYVESNISQKSHTTVKYALKMISSSSETIIFMFLGVATVNNKHVWNTWFVVLTITFCSVFRVFGVIILSAIANRFRLHKLSRVDQFVMSYGGLRGAVAFALVLLIDENVVKQKDMFVTTTIAVIYFTVFVQGITIKPLVSILNVKRANKRKPTMNERIHERFMDHLMAGIEDIVGKTGNYNVRDKFKRFDNRFIRPLLIRDLKGAEPKIIETYSKLTMRDAMEVMRRNPSTIGQMTGTESMSALFRNYTNNCIGGRWAPPTIYTTCPSLTNLDNTCSRNLDMHELDYNPSKKDLTDAKIHHLLAEELKPYRRASIQMHRRLSYSRHAVDDRDLSTQVNYKMQMNFRRMFNDRKHHKRSKRGANNKQQDGVKQNHVSFHDFQQNGTTKQFSHEDNLPKLTEVTVVGANDDWDDGLTFTAKSSLAENPIPEEDRNISRDSDGERRVATPTATESQLPWKRQGDEISDAVQQNEFPAWASNKEYLAYNSPSATFLGGINKPKQPKSVIGLFRRESSGSKGTGISIGSNIGIEVLADGSFARGSDPALAAALASMVMPSTSTHLAHNPRLDKRSQSMSTNSGRSGVVSGEGHAGPFPVTASHRRNVRRGSMLELTGEPIPEETYQHGHSKSLCEPAGDDWETEPLSSGGGGGGGHSTSTNSEKALRSSGREPLLPRSTPRAQIRRMGAGAVSSTTVGVAGNRNQVTTALLSASNSDYDDEYDEDEDEDFDLYDDENIVVTTTTTTTAAAPTAATAAAPKINDGRNRSGGSGSGGGGAPTTTTTTIRLTRKNDESII